MESLVSSIVGSAPFSIGDTVSHPDGRSVQIVGGQWLGEYGRFSNWWEWREVFPDGLGSIERGYGWIPAKP